MTNETIDLIIEWFAHIQQIATDRKTQTGAVMDYQHCLNEIAAIASDSKQFVKEYRNEQEPINEEELDKLAKSTCQYDDNDKFLYKHHGEYYTADDLDVVFKAGYRKSIEKLNEQRQKDLEFFIDWFSIRFNIPYNGDTVDGEPLAKDYFEWMKERNQLLKELIEQLRKDFYEETE